MPLPVPLLRTLLVSAVLVSAVLVSAVLGAIAPTFAAAAPAALARDTTRVVARPVGAPAQGEAGVALAQGNAATRAGATEVAPATAATAAILDAVAAAGGVPLDHGGAVCPGDDVRVRWRAPGIAHERGGWVEPLGPEPDAGTNAVNGIVACDGSTYAVVGVEAVLVDGEWRVGVVPSPDHGGEHNEDPPLPADPPVAEPGPADDDPRPVPLPAADRAIDDYATYQPQRRCDAAPRPGTNALRDHLLSTYPGTRSLGILRSCGAGGMSEHKEGRAFDWGVNADVDAERRAAERFLTRLLATDATGNRHALARRMGIMYVIWDRRIWSAYAAEAGWRPYGGWSPHRDHVHISLSWDGALGRTSFWSGNVVTGTPGGGTGGGAGGGSGGGTGGGSGKGGGSGGGSGSGGGTGGGSGSGGGTGGGSDSGSDGGTDETAEPDRVGPPPTMTIGVEPTVERVGDDDTQVRVQDTSARGRRWRERAGGRITTTSGGVPGRRLPTDRGTGAPAREPSPEPTATEPVDSTPGGEPSQDGGASTGRQRDVGTGVAPPATPRDRWDRVREP